MRFKIVDKGTKVAIRYVAYVRTWFIFPSWQIIGGSEYEDHAEVLCQKYYDTRKPQEVVREFNIP